MSDAPKDELIAFDEFRKDDPDWWEHLRKSVISQSIKDRTQRIITPQHTEPLIFKRRGQDNE